MLNYWSLEEYDPRKLDVWSCAIVYITLHFGGFPWNEATTKDKMYAGFIGYWESWLSNHPDGIITSDSTVPGARIFQDMKPPLRRMLYRMLHPLPEKRILIDEALNDRWMNTSVECCVMDEEVDKDGNKKVSKQKVMKLHNHLPSSKRTLHHEV